MAKWAEDTLTEQQRKWFASVRQGLERDTGRSLEDWVEIAKTCPETRHRARLAWFKANHGLAQNRASLVLSAAFPSPSAEEEGDDPLWIDPKARATRDAVEAAVRRLPDVLVGRRKGYTPFSRAYQFAAVRPMKDGTVRLGLAVASETNPRLQPPGREGWSERLKSVAVLSSPAEVNDEIESLLKTAWEAS